jgi:hypothetical protein
VRGIHVFDTGVVAEAKSLIHCEMSHVGSISLVDKSAIHYNVVTILQTVARNNVISIKTVAKERTSVVLIDEILVVKSALENLWDVLTDELRLETLASLLDGIPESKTVLLVKSLESTNNGVVSNGDFVTNANRSPLEVVTQPMTITLLKEVDDVINVATLWIVNLQRLVVVSGSRILRSSLTSVAATDKAEQTKRVVAVGMPKKNLGDVADVVADSSSTSLSTVEQ